MSASDLKTPLALSSRRQAAYRRAALVALVCLVGASPALAGTNSQYPVIVTGGSYAPLGDAGTPVPNVTGTQNGVDAIALNGWTFPFFDAGYTEITVTTDGYLIVGDGLLGGCTPDAGIDPNTGLQADSPGCGGPSTFCGFSGCTGCCLSIPNACTSFSECGGGCCTLATTYPPYQLGPSTSARGTIAAWWESLDDTTSQGIGYVQGGGTGSHFLTVDYHGVPTNMNSFNGFNSYNFSITLNESGLIQMAYGTTAVLDAGFFSSFGTGGPDQSVAWVSLEDPAGTTWVTGLGCDYDGGFSAFKESSCSAYNGDWPTNTDLTFGSPAGVYLEPESITATNGAVDGGVLSFTVAALAGDLGQTAVTTDFPYNVYLVQNLVEPQNLAACPGGAGCLGNFTLSGGISAQSSVPLSSGTLTTPYPPASGPGTYYVELWLDPANSTGNTSNAVGLSPPLLVGIELSGSVNLAADAGSGGIPPLVPGTGTFQVPITLQNSGLLPANGVEYQLWLTAGNTSINTATDFMVEDTTIDLNGGADLDQNDTATTLNATQGTYYIALAIDPASNLSGVLDPDFVTFSPGQVTVSPAHLKVTQVAAPADGYIGFPTHVGYTISNDGADPATGFSLGLLIHPSSRGSSFTINDPQLLELDGVSIPAGCTVQAEDDKIITDTPTGCAVFPTAASDGGVLQSVVPTVMYGTATAPGNYLVGVVADLYSQVNETRNANRLASATDTVIFPPEPDFSVGPGDVTAPTAAAAGDRIYVDRQIHNIGIAGGTAPYSYFLSAVGQANSGGIPVPVVQSGGTTFLPTTIDLAAPGQGISDDLGTDLLALPTTLPPGNYTLSLVVDPGEQTPELNTANDTTAAAQPIAIVTDGLQIVSANLPTALVQVPYAYQLVATGALATPSWTIVSGGLPAGLSLAATGAISGTPTATGTSSFIVEATVAATGAAAQTQIAALDITVAQASGPLQVSISGTELPPATVGRPYTMQLAAVGGVPPYRWSGTPPGGGDLVLEPSGLIAGTPTAVTPGTGPAQFKVTVSDQAGNSTQANLRLQIVNQGTLVITTTTLPPVTVGQAFSATIDATENDNLTHQYTWSLPAGQSLPPGVNFTQSGSPALGELSGTASRAGTWEFRIEVTDEAAHTASRQLILLVQPELLALPAQSLPPATAGQAYNATLQSSGNTIVTFSLFSGDLPPGLGLAASGVISGTVDPASDARQFPFVVLAHDDQGAQALVPLSILVQSTAPSKGGCSTGAGEATWLALALGLWLVARSSRARPSRSPRAKSRGEAAWPLPALALAAALLLPAQAFAWSYTVSQSTTTWMDITSETGVVLLANPLVTFVPVDVATAFPVTLPFQFTYDVSVYNSMTVWSNGALSFDPGSVPVVEDKCGGFPYSGSTCPPPTTLVAPWWGDLTVCPYTTNTAPNGPSVAYLVAGTTGSRTLTIQWAGVNTDDFCDSFSFSGTTEDSFYSFQAVLHEGTGNIDFIYGPYSAGQFPFCEQNFSTGTCSFAGGMEDGPAGTAALSCAANCASTVFPSQGVEVSFSQHPDVQITQVQTPGSGVQGGNLLVTLQLFNKGGLPANGGTGSVYYSTDGQTFDASNPLATFGPFNLNGSTGAQIQRQVVIPATAPLGTGWIIATVSDPGDSDPLGKQVASPAFDIFGAEADLDAAGLTGPSAGNAGSAISLGVSIQNVGSAGASKIPYSYYLSSSPTVSPSDLVIGGGTIPSLAPGATYTNTDQAQLPASLPAGSYTVGVIVNPDKVVTEYTYSNNTAVAKPPMQVSSGALAITTTTVPAASVGAPYQTVLVASGGGGEYTWSLGTGTLPPGLQLAGTSGTVSGTPSTAGDNPVTVKVTDQNAQSATAPLDFKVAAQALPLAVLTNSLPGGSFGVNYSVALVAIGGAPPYQWSIVSGGGTPPPGIGISTDGTLAGAPEADGAFVFSVQVQDSTGATSCGSGASGPGATCTALDLQVLSPGSVGVAEAQLPPATEGVNYDGELLAAGGIPPYTWALVDDQRLPSGPGDQAQDLSTAMPGGLSLDPSGSLSGLATVAGTFALTVKVTDSSSPPGTASDTVLLPVLPGTALQILNPTVPDATVGKPYIDTLDTNASNASVTFSVVDGLGNDSDAARQSLPPGLVLDPAGVLEGTPAASAAGNTSKTYDFLVKADDGTGRITVAAIALTVDPPASSGGCTSGAGGESMGIVAGALVFLGLRRRRRS